MKILFLSAGDPILGYLSEAATELGHEVCTVHTARLAGFAPLQKTIEDFGPDFCLTNNFYLLDLPFARELEAYFERKQIPLVPWYFDPPHASGSHELVARWNDQTIPTKNTLYLTADSGFLPFLKDRGVEAAHLPLAISPRLLEQKVDANLSQRFAHTCSYIGTPFKTGDLAQSTLQSLRNVFIDGIRAELWSRAYHKLGATTEAVKLLERIDLAAQPEIKAFFDCYHTDPSAYRVSQQKLFSFLDGLLPPELAKLANNFRGRIDFLYSWMHHALSLNELSSLGLRVYGGEDWKRHLLHYPHPTPRLTDSELLAAYRGSSSIFCETKFQFEHLMHDRPLAVLAIGGLPITDYRKDVEMFFEADEIVTYRSIEEAKSLITYYASHSEERSQLITKGRARVLRDHTYRNRTAELLAIVDKHFNITMRPKATTKDLRPLRETILEAASLSQEGHIPSAFSILEMLWVLYDEVLELKTPNPDCFILSKGHASLGLYAVLAEKGFFPKEELKKFASYSSFLGGHPDSTKVPGVEASTGSLGHGLPMAVGRALAYKIQNRDSQVYCLIGDGEANEGSVWESALLASHHALANLAVLVDFNHSTDRALSLGSLVDKFEAFGWKTVSFNGHSPEAIRAALTSPREGKPLALIAETIKGYGCKALENNPAWHHKSPKAEELETLKRDLY